MPSKRATPNVARLATTNVGTQILRRPDVEKRVGLSTSTLYRMIGEGKFPRPLKLTAKAVGWPDHVIERWLAARHAEVVA